MSIKHQKADTGTKVQTLFSKGVYHHGRGQLGQAISFYQKVLKCNARHSPSLHHLGMAYWQKGAAQKALTYVRKALHSAPQDYKAHNTMGLIWTSLQKYDRAEKHFVQALELKPSYAEAYFNLARLYFLQSNWTGTRRAAERLLALKPDHELGKILRLAALAESGMFQEIRTQDKSVFGLFPGNPFALYLIGKIHFKTGAIEQAINYYDQALKCDPNHQMALYGKVLALLELGEKEQAREILCLILDADPTYVPALRQLAKIHKFIPGDAVYKRLKKADQEKNAHAPAQKAELYYAWAKYYADTDQSEKTFSCWQKAGQAKAATLDYQFSDTAAQIDEITALFPRKPNFQIKTPAASFKPIFIVGMPRSGTTLMEQILVSHPDVSPGGESRYFEQALGDLAQYQALKDNSASTATLEKAAKQYLDWSGAEAGDTPWLTDKMPYNYLYLPFIHTMLPDAKILHMIRNPLDTCLSCYGLLFNSGHEWSYDLHTLGRYYKLYSRTMDHWRKILPPDSFLDVRYEDLVTDMEGRTAEVLEYCGLSWDDNCLSFYKNKRAVNTASTHQVRQPAYTSSIERWRQYETQLKPLIKEIGPLVEKHGYKL